MDIRELLVSSSATEELDESSPVSASDLHLLKDRLHVRSLQIKDRVHKYVKSHYQDFSSITSRASYGASKVENIFDNLNGVLQLLDKPSAGDGKGSQLPIDVDVDLCQLAAQARALNKCLNEKKESLALVQTISLFVQGLRNAEQNMIVEQGRLVESARAINLLRFALKVPENWKDDEIGVSWEPKAFTLLKSQWVSCFSKLQDLLEDMFDTAIQVDNANSKLYINLHITCEKLPESLSGVELLSVLTAMDVVLLMEKVRMLWQPLLQPPIYKKVLHSILQHLFSRIGSEILMLDDMAVEETLQLQKLIKTAFQNMSSLLKSVIDEDIEMQNTVEGIEKQGLSEISWDQLEKLIPSLQKLRRITDLLDMPLKSITLAWESGELIASGFTSLEVKKLIRAVFSDSHLRRECLRRIETTEFL